MEAVNCRRSVLSLDSVLALRARRGRICSWGLVSIGLLAACGSSNSSSSSPFLNASSTPSVVASTVPDNGDLNPYGTGIVQQSTGNLVQGEILVSNFNNSQNEQGTGTTIVQVAPAGTVELFAQIDASALPGPCPGGVGLTTALAILQTGWVIVGSLPTTDGTSATAQAGCLIILNNMGQPVETLSGSSINGPWDMTATETNGIATLYVTNVLDGTVAASPNVVNNGTVERIELTDPVGDGSSGPPMEMNATVIASGFSQRTDPDALVIGITGVGLSRNGTLYVADTLHSRIAAISNAATRTTDAGTGQTVSTGGALNGPLGLTIAPNGDILTVNSNDGNIVETTPGGSQIVTVMLDPGAGALFGLAIGTDRKTVFFVDDSSNTLNMLP